MDTVDILRLRLRTQLIEGSAATTVRDVVSHLLAMQAQDHAGATWAIGLRLPHSTLADIERGIAERTIVRTWPMRGTLHFVAAEDVRWMLALLTPRVLASAATRERQLELDAATIARARELFAESLAGGRRITRPDAMALLEARGIPTGGQRGYHILWRLAQEALIVLGPAQGKHQTFVLLNEWLPAETGAPFATALREQMLALLAARYFAGHGPATVDDLARWAGIPKREARAGLAAVADTLESAQFEGAEYWFAPTVANSADVAERSAASAVPGAVVAPSVHLLPAFDEYLIGYVGRAHQLGEHLLTYGARVGANGMLSPTVVIDGRAVGIWKRSLVGRSVSFTLTEFHPLSAAEHAAVESEQRRFARFLGREGGSA